MNSLTLATTRNFNGHTLNCYVENNPEEKYDFWATREQIGQFLGYSHPKKSIGNIHARFKERLDRFSMVRQIDTPSRGVQTATVYCFKGLLEICRFSNQPNANKVIDILWDIADEIRRKGYYVHLSAKSDVDKIIEECKALRAENEMLMKTLKENRSFILLGQAVSIQKDIEQGILRLIPHLGAKSTTEITFKGLQTISEWFTEEYYPMLALLGINEAANA